ncbi:MAG: YicC/YloC family endoribonuclease [Deltaproteobacteria bacterium]
MITGMTGFGQAEERADGERFVVTLKTVNHRYFDTSFHLPPSFEHLEGAFRDIVQGRIRRGRVNISVSHFNEACDEIVLNEELIGKYVQTLERVRRRLKLKEGIDLVSLVTLPGVLRHSKPELKMTVRERVAKRVFKEALEKVLVMRRREGAALARDLARRVGVIARHMTGVKRRVEKVRDEMKATLPPENLEGVLRSTDVSEEMTRIDFHLKGFLRHLKGSGSKGKVLDFIGQELQREINTLGAKVQDKLVAHEVVLMKDEVEKIREQVQNVE